MFIFVAFILKFKSLIRPDFEPDGQVDEGDSNFDIWAIKGSDDFLHFLKFESYQISFYTS